MKDIRIVLADDHKIMRMGLVTLLEAQRGMKVVGEADDGAAAVELAARLAPDVMVLDLMMPNMDGAEATAEIHRRNPGIGIVILSSFGDSAAMVRALANGARGAQAKESSPEELVAAIRAVARGERAVAPEIERFIRTEPEPPELTDKQIGILNSLTRGLTNSDIGKEFGISSESVKKHLSVIFDKLGAASRSEAVAIALRKHLLKM